MRHASRFLQSLCLRKASCLQSDCGMKNHSGAQQSLPRSAPLSGTFYSIATNHQSGKTSSKQPISSHRQFWLGISRVAGSHTCLLQMTRHPAGICEGTADDTASTSYSGSDLLVVGPGVLGGLVGKLWREAHPQAQVMGQTNTDSNHDRLRRLGLAPRLKQNADSGKFPSVLFSAPPSGSADYVGEASLLRAMIAGLLSSEARKLQSTSFKIRTNQCQSRHQQHHFDVVNISPGQEGVRNALRLWDGSGSFVFTSSSGVLKPPDGEDITEDTMLHPIGTSERIDRLLSCEQAVLEAGGCVLRLVGLYHAARGAHTFFLRQGDVPRWGGHTVNLIHYEDAASLCLKVLQGGDKGPFRGQTFLGTDSQPLTFQEMMDATTASGAFRGTVNFTGLAEERSAPGSSNSRTRKTLGWTPRYSSFKDFMRAGARDFYSQ